MAYTPSLADLDDETTGYTPSLADLDDEPITQQAIAEPQKNPTMHDLLSSLISKKDKSSVNRSMMDIEGENIPLNIGKDVLLGMNNFGEHAAGAVFGDKAAKGLDDKMLGLKSNGIDKFIQNSIEYVPYAAAGGAGLLGQTAAGGAFGAATAEKGNMGGSALEGALINALTHGAGSAINAFRPSVRLRGNLPTEELIENTRIAGNDATGLGDIVGSPYLKRKLENKLSKTPFSGANQRYMQTAQNITDEGNQIYNQYSNGVPEERLTDKLGEALKKAKSEHTKSKDNLYTESNKLADEAGLRLELPKFSALAKKHESDIESTNLLQFEPDAKSLLSRLKNYKTPVQEVKSSIVSADGKPLISEIKYPSLKEANILASRLNGMAKQYRASPNVAERNKARVLGDLGRTLKEEIRSSVADSGHEGLKNEFSRAEENYKKNYSPFLDKDIHKFTEGGKSPDDLVQTFIKTGRASDKSNQLAKLIDRLNPEQQDHFRAAYFSRAMDGAEGSRQINPRKLATLWGDSNLGIKQKKALIPSQDQRKQLDDFVKKIKMNSHALDIMHNPKTGQTNLDSTRMLSDALYAGAGGALGGFPGAVAGTILPLIGAKAQVSALTSPAVRQKLINKMIENEKIKGKRTPAAQTIAQSLAQLLSQQGS